MMDMGGFGFLGGIGMLLFWALIIGLLAWVIKGLFGSSDNSVSSAAQTALEILNQRYARGDIDREEFEAKRRDLRD